MAFKFSAACLPVGRFAKRQDVLCTNPTRVQKIEILNEKFRSIFVSPDFLVLFTPSDEHSERNACKKERMWGKFGLKNKKPSKSKR